MRLPARSLSVRHASFLLLLLVGLLTAGAVAVVQQADATVTTLATFSTPGYSTWTVPTGVTSVTFNVYGGRGGGVVSVNHNVVTVISQGGAGGEAKARFAVHAGEVFWITVGGQGGSYTLGSSQGGAGGFGGGGYAAQAGGGGGESDVRLGGRGNPCATSTCGYDDRFIVAGGGGGGSASSGVNGDSGGGLTGSGSPGCPSVGESATQECRGFSSGACAGSVSGAFYGANGCGTAGGGGGGWWGGGSNSTGGGGSGYINPFSKSGSFPTATNQGDGKVIITT